MIFGFTMNIQENIPLAPYTTFKIGGAARYFIIVRTTDELRQAVYFAKEKKLPFLVLGGGSNMLVSDTGFPGVVVHMQNRGVTLMQKGIVTYVTVAAGETWDSIVSQAV